MDPDQSGVCVGSWYHGLMYGSSQGFVYNICKGENYLIALCSNDIAKMTDICPGLGH